MLPTSPTDSLTARTLSNPLNAFSGLLDQTFTLMSNSGVPVPSNALAMLGDSLLRSITRLTYVGDSIPSSPLAMLGDLFEIRVQGLRQLCQFAACLFVHIDVTQSLFELFEQLSGKVGKIIHEVERVFDFVSNASRELTKRRELLRLYQAVLRVAQGL